MPGADEFLMDLGGENNRDAHASTMHAMQKAGVYRDGMYPYSKRLQNVSLDYYNKGPRANPYEQVVADRSRGAQMSALDMLQASMRDPNQNIAGQQGAMAQGQNAMSALAAQGQGPLGSRGAAGMAGGIGAQLAAQAAHGRSQENMGRLQGLVQGAGGVRGSDMQTQADMVRAGFGMRGLDDKSKLFHSGLGSQLALEEWNNELERYKLYQRLLQQKQANRDEYQKQVIDGAAKTASVVAGGMV